MPIAPIDRLLQLLRDDDRDTRHSASLRLPAETLELHLDGVGDIPLPLRPADAKRLISGARPAAFGRGHDTLHDTEVRDTWELTPGQFTLGGPRWASALPDALERLGWELGLPAGTRLRAEPHSLLVYGKGQFFAPHQDSEKHDEMVATLVVTLPSAHSGGELVVDDHGKLQRYAGSRSELVLVAFYADRRHEVLPVRTGHRVAVTFNLIADTVADAAPPDRAVQAASLLRAHFAAPTASRFHGHEPSAPRRLALFLGHEYSQHGLASGRLKGADAQQAALLGAAAELAGFETTLAQAELHETRDAAEFIDAHERRYGGYGRGYDIVDDEYDEESGDEYDDGEADYESHGLQPPTPSLAELDEDALGEVLDESTRLTWWTLDGGGGVDLQLDHEEVHALTPSSSLRPYAAEYEGYMGNYGNTVDRWYRRAALLLWPREYSFATRAETNAAWALRKLADRIRAGDLDRARAEATSLAPIWRGERFSAASADEALDVAVGLADGDAALVVLAPFGVEDLAAGHAPLLAELDRDHGDEFWQRLHEEWRDRGWSRRDAQTGWSAQSLAPLARALREAGAEGVGARFARWTWSWLRESISRDHALPDPEERARRLAALGPSLAAVLLAADEPLADDIVLELASFDDPIGTVQISALRSGQADAQVRRALAAPVRARLTRQLTVTPRSPGDWSIEWSPQRPGDDDETRLAAFLRSPETRSLTWPLAEARRNRIQQLIERAALPVHHRVQRSGRPYKTRARRSSTAKPPPASEPRPIWPGWIGRTHSRRRLRR